MCTPSVPQLGNTPKRLLLVLMLPLWLLGGEGALAHPADARLYESMSDGGADCSELASWFHGLSGTLAMILVGVGCGIGLIGSLVKRKYALTLCYSTLIIGIYVIRSLFLVWCDQHSSLGSGSNGPTILDLYASELNRSSQSSFDLKAIVHRKDRKKGRHRDTLKMSATTSGLV
jgi:hypothetical protein